MADVIKHVFKYQEFARTLFLNLSAKDDYGRHRGQVLYGMKASPSGTKITIGPGAVFTPYGTKFYWDVTSAPASEIDFLNVQLNATGSADSVLAAANETVRPIAVAIIAEISPSISAAQQPQIEDVAEVDASTVRFVARTVATSRATTQPLLNLKPVNPVEMTGDQTPEALYDPIQTFTAFGQQPNRVLPLAGVVENESLQRFEVPLGYILIGVDSAGVAPTSLGTAGVWEDGIVYVPPYNAWEALTDFLGHDVLLGRAADPAVGTPADPAAALNQTPTTYLAGGTNDVPHTSPRFGTGVPGSAPNPWSVSWANYRPPSFMRDGEQLIWQLRRLDYVLRLWMDRTGDQELVSLIQDGAGTGLDRQAPLYQILNEFTGGTTDNQNILTWPDDIDAAHIDNQVLKTGYIRHDLQLLADTVSQYGDHHRGAIYALDLGIWHILTDILGYGLGGRSSLQRTSLRSTGSIPRSEPAFAFTGDGPLGHLPGAGDPLDDLPAVTGNAGLAYLSTEPVYDAIELVAKRAARGSQNLLKNPHFAAGDADNDGEGPIVGWTTGASWVRSDLATGLELKQIAFSFGAGQDLYQRVSGSALADVLENGTEIGVSFVLSVTSGSVTVEVRGLDSGLTELFTVTPTAIAAGAGLKAHSFTFTIDDTTSLEHLEFRIREDAASTASITVAGAWMGIGPAPENSALSSEYYEFLSRDAGEAGALREDLLLGGNDVFGGNLRTDTVWDDRPYADQDEVAPSYSGTQLGSSHIADDAGFKSALARVLEVAAQGQTANMLLNPYFTDRSSSGLETSTFDIEMPRGWAALNAGAGVPASSSWTRSGPADSLAGFQLALTLSDDMGLTQSITDALLHDLLTDAVGKQISASVTVQTDQDLTFVVRLLDAGSAELGRVERTIPANTGLSTYTLQGNITDTTTAVDSLHIDLINESGSAATVDLRGAWLGGGTPPQTVAPGAELDSVVNRDGGEANAFRHDMWVGTAANPVRARYVADPVDDLDAVNYQSLFSSQKLTFGTDGSALNNLTVDATVPHFTGLTISSPLSTPHVCSLIFVQGDVVISDTLTLLRDDHGVYTQYINDRLQVRVGGQGAASGDQGNGGGGLGVGGHGFSISAFADSYEDRIATNLLYKSWIHYVGGQGGNGDGGGTIGGRGGGSLILLVDGDVTLSGVIDGSGLDGQGATGGGSGGGGGGSVRIVCTGTFDGTGGVIDVTGGDWGNIPQSGGGGGGYASILASTVAASPTILDDAGASETAGGNGDNHVLTTSRSNILAWLSASTLAVG